MEGAFSEQLQNQLKRGLKRQGSKIALPSKAPPAPPVQRQPSNKREASPPRPTHKREGSRLANDTNTNIPKVTRKTSKSPGTKAGGDKGPKPGIGFRPPTRDYSPMHNTLKDDHALFDFVDQPQISDSQLVMPASMVPAMTRVDSVCEGDLFQGSNEPGEPISTDRKCTDYREYFWVPGCCKTCNVPKKEHFSPAISVKKEPYSHLHSSSDRAPQGLNLDTSEEPGNDRASGILSRLRSRPSSKSRSQSPKASTPKASTPKASTSKASTQKASDSSLRARSQSRIEKVSSNVPEVSLVVLAKVQYQIEQLRQFMREACTADQEDGDVDAMVDLALVRNALHIELVSLRRELQRSRIEAGKHMERLMQENFEVRLTAATLKVNLEEVEERETRLAGLRDAMDVTRKSLRKKEEELKKAYDVLDQERATLAEQAQLLEDQRQRMAEERARFLEVSLKLQVTGAALNDSKETPEWNVTMEAASPLNAATNANAANSPAAMQEALALVIPSNSSSRVGTPKGSEVPISSILAKYKNKSPRSKRNDKRSGDDSLLQTSFAHHRQKSRMSDNESTGLQPQGRNRSVSSQCTLHQRVRSISVPRHHRFASSLAGAGAGAGPDLAIIAREFIAKDSQPVTSISGVRNSGSIFQGSRFGEESKDPDGLEFTPPHGFGYFELNPADMDRGSGHFGPGNPAFRRAAIGSIHTASDGGDLHLHLSKLLQDPEGLDTLRAFADKEHNSENIVFYGEVNSYKELVDKNPGGRIHSQIKWRDNVMKDFDRIYETYVKQDGVTINFSNLDINDHEMAGINIGAKQREDIKQRRGEMLEGLTDLDSRAWKEVASVFDAAMNEVFHLILRDTFRRYLHSEPYEHYKQILHSRHVNRIDLWGECRETETQFVKVGLQGQILRLQKMKLELPSGKHEAQKQIIIKRIDLLEHLQSVHREVLFGFHEVCSWHPDDDRMPTIANIFLKHSKEVFHVYQQYTDEFYQLVKLALAPLVMSRTSRSHSTMHMVRSHSVGNVQGPMDKSDRASFRDKSDRMSVRDKSDRTSVRRKGGVVMPPQATLTPQGPQHGGNVDDGDLSLEMLIEMPLHRMKKYSEYITSEQKLSTPSHPNRELLAEALTTLHKVTEYLDKALLENQRWHKILQLGAHTEWQADLFEPQTRFIRSSVMEKKNHSGGIAEREVFLFNKFIVITPLPTKGGAYSKQRILPVNLELKVHEECSTEPGSPCAGTVVTRPIGPYKHCPVCGTRASIFLGNKVKNILLYADDRESWIRDLQIAVVNTVLVEVQLAQHNQSMARSMKLQITSDMTIKDLKAQCATKIVKRDSSIVVHGYCLYKHTDKHTSDLPLVDDETLIDVFREEVQSGKDLVLRMVPKH